MNFFDKPYLNVKYFYHSYSMVNLCSRVTYKSASTAFKENKTSLLHRDQKVFSKVNGKIVRTEKILHVVICIHMHSET